MMAPGMEVNPPIRITGSALNASSEIENCTPSFDPHIRPANSATIAEADHTTAQMFFSGMPTESAAWWSSATARSPRPTRVLLKNQASAATSAAAVTAATTSKMLTNRPTLSLSQAMGTSGMPMSRACTSASHTPCATPSMTKFNPIAAMNRMMGSWLTRGRSTIRSMAMAIMIITSRVIASARHRAASPRKKQATARPSRIPAAQCGVRAPTVSIRKVSSTMKTARHIGWPPSNTIGRSTTAIAASTTGVRPYRAGASSTAVYRRSPQIPAASSAKTSASPPVQPQKSGPTSSIRTKVRAANRTKAPCAKLKIWDALKISTRPSATSEYMMPVSSPPTSTSKKNRISSTIGSSARFVPAHPWPR